MQLILFVLFTSSLTFLWPIKAETPSSQSTPSLIELFCEKSDELSSLRKQRIRLEERKIGANEQMRKFALELHDASTAGMMTGALTTGALMYPVVAYALYRRGICNGRMALLAAGPVSSMGGLLLGGLPGTLIGVNHQHDHQSEEQEALAKEIQTIENELKQNQSTIDDLEVLLKGLEKAIPSSRDLCDTTEN